MKVAVLFTTDTDMKGLYRKDWQGRDDNGHAFSVMKALEELGHKPLEYHANLNLFKKFKSEKHKIDLVFNLVDDGFYSDSQLEAHVPALLDLLKIRYTGSGLFCISLCLNKAMTKKVLLHHKIPTPRFQVFTRGDEKISTDLKFPLFVKPVREDSSVGIRNDSMVKNKTDLRKKIRTVLKDYKQPALVEEFIDGREFSVGVLGSQKRFVLPISEIFFDLPPDFPKIVNYDAKWNENSKEYNNTNSKFGKISDKLHDQLVKYALQVGDFLQCHDYYRVDFRVDKKGRPFVLEVNPNPDISEDAGLAKMAKQAGMDYPQMIDYIVRSARSKKLK
jgi:D-alanine-D-alanine ligase